MITRWFQTHPFRNLIWFIRQIYATREEREELKFRWSWRRWTFYTVIIIDVQPELLENEDVADQIGMKALLKYSDKIREFGLSEFLYPEPVWLSEKELLVFFRPDLQVKWPIIRWITLLAIIIGTLFYVDINTIFHWIKGLFS